MQTKMLLKPLVLLAVCVLSCCAQLQLTCTQSSALPTGSSIINNEANREQGPPRKKCPTGARGRKGQKGDPGITDNSVVNQLRDEMSSLREQLTNQSDKILALERRLESKFTTQQNGISRLDDGWVGLSNGYQYKLQGSRQTYDESRSFCKGIGADLAVYGIRTMNNRRMIRNALNPSISMWIGLNDIDEEGTWRWINGDSATDAEALWSRGQPNGRNGQDCAYMAYENLLSYDFPCSFGRQPLCEKQWN